MQANQPVVDRPVHVSLGGYPGRTFMNAAWSAIYEPRQEPLFGQLSPAHMQLCPQNMGALSEEGVLRLQQAFPGVQFRLHANVRTARHRVLTDIVQWANPDFADEWARLAQLSQQLGAPAYTGHAGHRRYGSLQHVIEGLSALEDRFQCRVGVEGHYPTPNDEYLLVSWEEYAALLASGASYVIDFSHLNILAHHTHRRELSLIEDLVASEQCLEIHVSDNDGHHDSHYQVVDAPWWLPLLGKAHPGAVLFSEGIPRAARTQ